MAVLVVTITNATTDSDLEHILELQRRNLRQALTPQQQSEQGFVYLEHDLPLLRRMSARLPQAVAVFDGRVVGYCLALSVELRGELPKIEELFSHFERCTYLGRPLSSYRFFVGGQVCVDRDFRGRGLAERLYRQAARSVPQRHDLCITEIARRNQVSIAAHEKIGFRDILRYSDGVEDWVVVVWDLAQVAWGPGSN